MVAAIGVAAAYTWWNARGLRLHIALKSGESKQDLPDQLLRAAPSLDPVFEGDQLVVDVGLDTTGAQRGPASISGLIGDKPQTMGTGVVQRGGWRRTLEVSEARRGVLSARSWVVTATDSLGFFRTTTRCEDFEVGLVFPRFASLAGRRQVRELEASLAAPRAGSGNELFGIREYRAGDSLRRIHWRSSARHGELVVREYEPPGLQTLGICVESLPYSGAVADQICRIAVSEAWDCIRDGGRVVVWAPDLEPTPMTRDLWTVLEWLARYPDLPSGAYNPTLPETVLITSSALDVGATRAWFVGDAPFDLDIPYERVRTEWPL